MVEPFECDSEAPLLSRVHVWMVTNEQHSHTGGPVCECVWKTLSNATKKGRIAVENQPLQNKSTKKKKTQINNDF